MSPLDKFTTYLGGFGWKTLKPLTLLVSFANPAPLIVSHTSASKAVSQNGALKLSKSTQKTTSAKRGHSGWKRGVWVTGSKDQKASQSYTPAFCSALASVIMSEL